MKKTLFVTAILLLSNFSFSQDVIIKRDGSKLEVKVIEITTSVIKYRNFNQLEGPLRNIAISEVNEIIYEDGQWDKFDEKVVVAREEEVIEEYTPRKPKDHILGNGLFLDGMICYAIGTQQQENYSGGYYDSFGNYIPGATIISTVDRNYIGLNVRLGHKWYFGSSGKWRPGIQATWARIGVFFAPDITDYNPKFTLSLLNAGFANAFKFNNDNGLEANANVGFTMNSIPLPGLGNTPDIGIIYGAELKYRHKAFAVGLDFSRINLNLGDAYRSSMNVIALTVGFKM